MSWTPNSTSTPIALSTHPLAGLLKIALDPTISVEARLLYVILVLMAWTKGRCWPSQAYQARALGRSDRSVRDYHHELEKAGLLIVERKPGVVNRYHPSILNPQEGTPEPHCRRAPETGCRITLKSELQNVNNVPPPPQEYVPPQPPPSPEPENVNAIEICPEDSGLQETIPDQPIKPSLDSPRLVQTSPDSESVRQKCAPSVSIPQRKTQSPLTQDHLFLVEEIERTTGDTWSRGHFSNLVRQFSEQTIYSALSVTREKLTLESGVNGGAYFTTTLRGMAGIQRLGTPRTSSTAAPLHDTTPEPPVPPRSTPMPEPVPTEEIDTESLIKGWKILYHPDRIKSVLFQVGQCLQDWDVTGAWESLKDDRAGQPEIEVLDEFLELAAFKVKFQSMTKGEPST